MTIRLFFWSLTSALAGFLFGFDTVVISGAEQTIQSLWGLSPGLHGLAMGSALYGTVLGSLLGGWPTDRFGRKTTLLWIGVLYFVSAVWSGLASGVYAFILARFIGGLGVGISTVAAPLYISEIAPAQHRGRLAGMFQFNIVFGILVAFVSNALLAGVGEHAWRWMLGVEAFPALVYAGMCFSLPESPRWLIGRKGNRADGLRVLGLIRPGLPAADLAAKADEIAAASSAQKSSARFWTRRLRLPILLAVLIAFFNQLSGINAVLYFAPRIFGLTGSGAGDALLHSVGIGVTNLVFTFVGLWLIDRLGRRTLLVLGSCGYILSLGLCAWAFFHWAPQFKVASSAWELIGLATRLDQADPTRRAKVQLDFDRARETLADATRDARWPLGRVIIPAEAAPAQAAAIAEECLARASQSAGPGSVMVLVCIFAFIASHAIGQGAVIWVFIAEIFPNRHRAEGQALGSFTHWMFAALLTTLFPKMVTALAPGWVFLFFCGMMGLQLVWVTLMVPETKGVPLEQIQRRLLGESDPTAGPEDGHPAPAPRASGKDQPPAQAPSLPPR
ncbi:MAG: sugar porter family MFS transporter [Verrucomicrobia bacterium]|nr:sugar porter family MFS transporter [Verrucomicrobiota bacterium]